MSADFNPGFFGKKPLKWWIGQVPLGQTENKTHPDKWGDRVQVRIYGHDPKDGALLADEDLDWAIVLKPTSQGSLNKGSTAIGGGEMVMGFFMNDTPPRVPVIVGVIGRTDTSYEINYTQQQSQNSTEFKVPNIFAGRNVCAEWNYGAGPPSGDTPFVPDQSSFNIG